MIDDFVNFPGFREPGLQAFAEFFAGGVGPDNRHLSLEVLAAPWTIIVTSHKAHFEWDPDRGRDGPAYLGGDEYWALERAVAFRVVVG